MREFDIPLAKLDWVQRWCCDVHNILAIRGKDWRTPLEISSGHTPDISKFRFHIWEPVWYFEPTKSPIDSWKKGRWLGFAHSTGDVMTYYVETAETGRKPQVLMRSSVISRSQHQDNPTNDLSNQTQKHTTSGYRLTTQLRHQEKITTAIRILGS